MFGATAAERLAIQSWRLEIESWISAKAHRVSAEKWGSWYYGLGVPAAVTAGVASLSVLADAGKWVVAGFAIASAALSTLVTFLRPDAESSGHRIAAAEYRALQEDLHEFWTDTCLSDVDEQTLRKEFRELKVRWKQLERAGPHVIDSRYKKAKKAVMDDLRERGRLECYEEAVSRAPAGYPP